MYKTKTVLAYWDYNRSYDCNSVIVLATDVSSNSNRLEWVQKRIDEQNVLAHPTRIESQVIKKATGQQL